MEQQKICVRRRNVIADSTSESEEGVHKQPCQYASVMNIGNDEGRKRIAEKYQNVVAKLQEPVQQNAESLKQKEKELLDRLTKAKHDIDAERKQRIEMKDRLEKAENESKNVVQELAGKIRAMVAEMTKIETKCKKHIDIAAACKKNMKLMKEEHQQRLNEMEEEIIQLNKRVKLEEEKYAKLYDEYHQQTVRLQQTEANCNYYVMENHKQVKSKLDNVSVELMKTQAEKAQIEHCLNILHHDVTQHHQEWSELNQTQKEQIQKLEQKINLLHQQNNALRNGTNLPPSTLGLLFTKNDHQNMALTSVMVPEAPASLKFNDLELEELKICRKLCQKLLETKLFDVEHMASRTNVTESLFLAWITGIGKMPTVINDLKTHNTVPTPDKNQHILMNSIRCLLIDIRQHLECIQKGEQGSHDAETLNKVKGLLTEFDSAATMYEQKTTEFKILQLQRLMEAIQQDNSVLEYLIFTGQDAEGNFRSDWVKVVVLQYEQQQNQVLIRKESGDKSPFWASVDPAVLRLPENKGNGSNNNMNEFAKANGNNSLNNGNHVHRNANHYRHTENRSPSMQPINYGQPSSVFPVLAEPAFNGIQELRPPLEKLPANTMICNAKTNNNNMIQSSTRAMNSTQHKQKMINDNKDERKRDARFSSKYNEKRKCSSPDQHSKKETDDEDESNDHTESEDSVDEPEASASAVSSDCDTESESESNKQASKRKKDTKLRNCDKKRTKKDKKHERKKDKASSKSRKKSDTQKKHDTEVRSVSRSTKRGLPSSVKTNDGNSSKKRKVDHTVTAQAVNCHFLANGRKWRSHKSDLVSSSGKKTIVPMPSKEMQDHLNALMGI